MRQGLAWVVTEGFMVVFFRYTTVDTTAGKARYR